MRSVIHIDEIALKVLGVKSTALAGMKAVMDYAAQYAGDGNLWPDSIEGDDGISSDDRNWHFYLL